MPHMSNLPWMMMFAGCLLSIWMMISLFNFQSKHPENLTKNNKINESNNKWEW